MKLELIIEELGLESLSKTSHKNGSLEKPLNKHIEEVRSISKVLARKHGLTESLDILDVLAEWHDIGKLNPAWCIDEDQKPPHSALSAYLFLKYSEKEDPRLFYFILKHHSSLVQVPLNIPSICKNVVGKIKYKIDQKEALNLIFKELRKFKLSVEDIKSNVDLVDLFGTFKTADILSAMFEEESRISKQNIDLKVELLKERLRDYVRSKNLKFDENKWKIFTEMARTDRDILFLAPTGWGKTFAALTVAVSKKPSHIIYVLPTITSIRKMRQSLQKLLSGVGVEENYYFADTKKLKRLGIPEETDIDLDLFISRSFISPVTITTLDQLLLSFLHVGKYFLKRYHFRNSVFIFDEFHLYPINGLYLLLYFFKKFNEKFKYNMRSVFMSATIHPVFRSLINQFIAPREFEFLQEYKKKRRYLYSLEENDITSDEVLKQIIEKSKLGNVLVICNTVEKAIRVYLLLKHNYKMKNNMLLLHSRYTYHDRRKKEEQLEKLSTKSREFIFISTQVSEVSLDISFDYLFTELAPIPSLIQRFGRVNRYSDFIDNINVNITYPEEINKTRFYPYDEKEIKFATSTLSELEYKIKNEFELIERLKDAPMLVDNAELNEIEKYLRKWEDDTRFFFSIDLKDEELNRLLKFRDTNTALIIPGCFTSDVLEILLSDRRYKSQLVKEYFVPVPIWWLFEKSGYIYKEKNLLFLSSQRFLYSQDVGYFDSEKLKKFVDLIDICVKSNNIA
ncbi:MAG: CRISPR-associated helicase Cas3' [Thermodesulfobacterium sp.]|nr:CRISPR-associated helicase Cas3' [Thermodesulfobacterium sp.]